MNALKMPSASPRRCSRHPVECTREAPCGAGTCGVTTGPPPPTCPNGCTAAFPPHSRRYPCICADNACRVPKPDAGTVQGMDSGSFETPCSYTIAPNPINFDFVRCGEMLTFPLTIIDVGPGACLVTGWALTCSDGGGPFNLTGGISSQRLSPPDGGPFPSQLTVAVAFDCTPAAGPFNCAFQFSMNGMQQILPVSGTCSCADGG